VPEKLKRFSDKDSHKILLKMVSQRSQKSAKSPFFKPCKLQKQPANRPSLSRNIQFPDFLQFHAFGLLVSIPKQKRPPIG
ncbi:MAG TPA: hypothetical protein DCS30_06840, partial [Rhizobiales bacterium]|nr:hypothetical protein [Hyphomicrobiales bacterium]